jgi:methionyl-tRNA synthetase
MAAAAILQLAEAANGFLNDRAPWKAIKCEDERPSVAADLYAVLETSRWVGLLLAPLLPDLSARMLQQLAQTPLVSAAVAEGAAAGMDQKALASAWTAARHWGRLAGGDPLPEPTPVMQRLDLESPL